jgi:hypothetical protein
MNGQHEPCGGQLGCGLQFLCVCDISFPGRCSTHVLRDGCGVLEILPSAVLAAPGDNLRLPVQTELWKQCALFP